MSDSKEPDVVIGRVVAPFGIKGEVKVRPETDFPERFETITEVWLASQNGKGRVTRIESVRFHQSMALAKFEGVDDRTAAEGLRGAELRIDEAELMELGPDEYYVHDLIGLDVYTTDGEHLGEITKVLKGAANDVYVTPRAMIPAVKQFVREIDIAGSRMVVEAVEGLLIDK